MDQTFNNSFAVVFILHIFETDERENNIFFDEALLLSTDIETLEK